MGGGDAGVDTPGEEPEAPPVATGGLEPSALLGSLTREQAAALCIGLADASSDVSQSTTALEAACGEAWFSAHVQDDFEHEAAAIHNCETDVAACVAGDPPAPEPGTEFRYACEAAGDAATYFARLHGPECASATIGEVAGCVSEAFQLFGARAQTWRCSNAGFIAETLSQAEAERETLKASQVCADLFLNCLF